MSYGRIFGDGLPASNSMIDWPLFYQYLTMSVEDAEYPTAVPLAVATLVLLPVIAGLDKWTGGFGFFAEDTSHARKAFLDIDGVDFGLRK